MFDREKVVEQFRNIAEWYEEDILAFYEDTEFCDEDTDDLVLLR